jgi:cytochrome P450
MHRRYGDTFTVKAEPTGFGVVLRDPADLRTIFRGDPEIFHAGEGNSLLTPIVGKRSVLTMDAPEHAVERRRMLPPFHGERIARVVALMETETEREVAQWPIGRVIELLPRMQALTLRIIVRVVLGVDEDDRARAVGAALRRVLAFRLRDMLLWLWPGLARVRPWTSVVRDIDRADELIYAEIERRRADPGRPERPDVLAIPIRSWCAMNWSPCWSPGTRRRRSRCRGHSNGYCAIPAHWPRYRPGSTIPTIHTGPRWPRRRCDCVP